MNSCGSCGDTTENDFVLCDECEQHSADADTALTAEVERLRAENVLVTNQEVLTANWCVELQAENAGLRSIITDVLLYFVMPSGEKKRAIRDRISKMPKPGSDA